MKYLFSFFACVLCLLFCNLTYAQNVCDPESDSYDSVKCTQRKNVSGDDLACCREYGDSHCRISYSIYRLNDEWIYSCGWPSFMSHCSNICSPSSENISDSSSILSNGIDFSSNDFLSCNNMGSKPAIFDDFSYSNTEYIRDNTNAGSIFGENIWNTCSNGEVIEDTTRMWYKYNHDDHEVNDNAKYILYGAGTTQAKLALRMEAGYNPEKSRRHPIIRSGLKTRRGTYAARVQFSELEDHARLMQSFWLQDHIDAAQHNVEGSELHVEADVEWNNWFNVENSGVSGSTGQSNIHVTNHSKGVNDNAKQQISYILQGRYYDDSMGHAASNLRDAEGNSYVFGEAKNNSCVTDEWWTIVINVIEDTVNVMRDTVKYSMQNAGYGGRRGTVWAGQGTGVSDWQQPRNISEIKFLSTSGFDAPTHGLNSQFGYLFANGGKLFNNDLRKTTLNHTSEMLVDWFYYTPEQLNLCEVEAQVAQIRHGGYSRLNTTGYKLKHIPPMSMSTD